MQALIAKIPGGKKSLLLLGLLLLIIGLIVFNIYKNRQAASLPVQTKQVESRQMGENVFATGKVQLLDKQEIYAPAPRLVKNVPVKVGQIVKKGQILLELESDNEALQLEQALSTLVEQEAAYAKAFNPDKQSRAIAQAEYRSAELAYQQSKKDVQRQEKLYQSGAASQQELETARQQLAINETAYLKAQYELNKIINGPQGAELEASSAQLKSAQTAVKVARETLGHYQVKAQIDGVVMSAQCSQGELAAVDKPLMVIGNPDSLEVQAGIGEADAVRLRKGQQVKIEAAAFPEKTFKGLVKELAMAAQVTQSNQSQQIEVPIKVAIESKNTGLLPGFTVDMKITTIEPEKRLTIPYETIIEKGNNKYVWRVKNGKAQRVSIKTGLMGDLYVEVLQGLHEKDTVIINPPAKLKNGQAVKPAPPAAKEAAPL